MEESKNIFLLDGPVGRKRFFVTLGLSLLYIIICLIISGLVIAAIGMNIYTEYALYGITIFLILFMIYVKILTYAKRLQDITSISKWKCLMYAILFEIATTALGAIPIVRFIVPLIGFVVFICLATIKGNLYSDNPEVIEAEVTEEESQENQE
jgi:uncharacterized membrane protein YhaH (DUF805 family)